MSHPRVAEPVAPGVVDEAADAAGPVVFHHLLLHQALLDGREIVEGGPFAAAVLAAEIILARLEGLAHHRLVAIDVVADGAEIVAAPVARQVLAPPVRPAFVGAGAVGFEALDPLWTCDRQRDGWEPSV